MVRVGSLRILVVRPDRIGDVVLSTPVFEYLKTAVPGCTVDALVREEVKPILDYQPFVDSILALKGPQDLAAELRKANYDLALVLQVEPQSTWAVRLASIPYRVGPLSKWYSFLCFNRGVRQSRSGSEKNEAEYNLDLASHAVRALGVSSLPKGLFPARLVAGKREKEEVLRHLEAIGLKGADFVLIHPGMGGSALNWPIERYAELLKSLLDDGFSVVLGGSTSDTEAIESTVKCVVQRGGNRKKLHQIRSKNLEQYKALLSLARVVVAPSTGPLHMASGLGIPVVSFYPPIQVQSSRRWGPFGMAANKVFVPDVHCGQKYKCLGIKCVSYYCMDRIDTIQVAREVKKLAKDASIEKAES